MEVCCHDVVLVHFGLVVLCSRQQLLSFSLSDRANFQRCDNPSANLVTAQRTFSMKHPSLPALSVSSEDSILSLMESPLSVHKECKESPKAKKRRVSVSNPPLPVLPVLVLTILSVAMARIVPTLILLRILHILSCLAFTIYTIYLALLWYEFHADDPVVVQAYRSRKWYMEFLWNNLPTLLQSGKLVAAFSSAVHYKNVVLHPFQWFWRWQTKYVRGKHVYWLQRQCYELERVDCWYECSNNEL